MKSLLIALCLVLAIACTAQACPLCAAQSQAIAVQPQAVMAQAYVQPQLSLAVTPQFFTVVQPVAVQAYTAQAFVSQAVVAQNVYAVSACNVQAVRASRQRILGGRSRSLSIQRQVTR